MNLAKSLTITSMVSFVLFANVNTQIGYADKSIINGDIATKVYSTVRMTDGTDVQLTTTTTGSNDKILKDL